MKYRWRIAASQPALSTECAKQSQISPLLAQCLINRGFADSPAISAFLDPRLKQLADPGRLPNMDAAVARLLCARERQELVVIFGDYDVDGVTSSALLVEVFSRLGWRAECYLPCRFDEGYGLSGEAVENCLAQFPAAKLLVAVDCGSTAVDFISWLRGRGIDVVVLDHHQVSNPAPAAVALVNPQLSRATAADPGEFCELCSVGIAFKLAHALVKRLREAGCPLAAEFDLRPLLDLVALGTIADIVPLTGENRILVSAGLERLGTSRRPGLVALKDVAQTGDAVNSYAVGYQLAPRLNAAGRLEDAAEALRLLLARTPEEAEPLARSLDSRNRERQRIERAITAEVTAAVRARFNPDRDFCIVEGGLLWHIGVVGIVASRVVQQFYRPTIILGGDGQEWRGSGRSIEGFDLAAALRDCDDLLLRHGGHAMAAGVSLHPDRVEPLRARLNELARRSLAAEQLKPSLRIDAEVDLAALTVEAVEEHRRLDPHGPGNPPVHFAVRRVFSRRPPQRMGKERQHAKFWVTDGRVVVEAVWWNCGSETQFPRGMFDLAFMPQINEFNGCRSVQLKVLDWTPVA